MMEHYYNIEEPRNFTIYAVFVYWILCVAPDLYAQFIISKANNWTYNNLRPWPAEYTAKLKTTVPVATWLQYEKLVELSKNSFEQFPLLIATVILGTFSGGNIHCLNLYVFGFLVLRVVYACFYLYTENHTQSNTCTVIWLVSTGLLLYQILKFGAILEYQRAYVVQTATVIVEEESGSKILSNGW